MGRNHVAVPPIDAGVIQVPIWIDLSAVVVGALAGALHATRQRFDAVGVLTFALVMGLGGGIIRDVLLNRVPVALTEKPYLPTVAVAAVLSAIRTGMPCEARPLTPGHEAAVPKPTRASFVNRLT